jgi:outer membrane protein TolC
MALLLFTEAPVAAAESPVLKQLLAEAENNPALGAAREQIAVSRARVPQQSSLDDPVLSLALSNYPIDGLSSSDTPMTGTEIRLAQKFPFPGKLAARGQVAEEQSRWQAAAYQDARLQIRRQVKDAWYRLLFQRRAIELTERNLELLGDFIKLTETRYAVGKGLQQNVLKAQLARSKQLDKLLSLQQQEAATLAELNSLAGQPTDRELNIASELVGVAEGFELSTLQQQAEQNRPLVNAYSALIEQYQVKRRLAKLDDRPDFNVWAGYRLRDNALPDDGSDFISAGVSFNLPVRRERRAAAVAEADSGLRLAYQQRNDFLNQVKLKLHSELTRFNQAQRLDELYRTGILPQAEQTFQATLSAYRVDAVDFFDLLDALMSLYRYQIDHARTLRDQQRSRAGLVAAAGLEIDALDPVPQALN